MASGRPSSRRQSRTTSARFTAVTVKSGSTEAARCANSSTASVSAGIGATGKACSPGASNGCLLVASTVTSGAARSTDSANEAQASTRCSQVSRISSRRRSRRCSSTAARCAQASRSGSPSAAATASASRAGSLSPDSSTIQMPCGKRLAGSEAARRQSRVLPTPPGPTTVISRADRSCVVSQSSSLARPTKVFASAGSRPGLRRPATWPARSGWAMATSHAVRDAATITLSRMGLHAHRHLCGLRSPSEPARWANTVRRDRQASSWAELSVEGRRNE